MATYEQLIDAARRADQAGDEQAARRFLELAAGQTGAEENVVATTPDGGRFIRREDGSTVFSSPGYSTTDPETVERLMGGDSVQQVVQSGFDRDVIAQNPVAARVQEFNRGTPFIGSRLDEAVGLVSPTAADAMRTTSAAMQRENPGQTAALNVGGAFGYGIPMAMGAVQIPTAARALAATRPGQALAASSVGRALAPLVPTSQSLAALVPSTRAGQALAGGLLGAAAGAGEGAIYGSGEGTTPEERSRNARDQAALGGAFGGVLGLAAPVAGEVFGALAQRWRGSDIDAISKQFGVSRDSAKVIKQAFQQNDQGAFDSIMRAGSEATLADAGRSGQALLDAAAQTGGRPLNIMDNAVTARANRSEGLITQAFDDALGPVSGPRQAAREISEQSAPARRAAYDAAYNTPIDYASPEGREVEGLLSRLSPARFQEAARLANERLMWEGGQRQILIDIADNGAVSLREMPSVRQLDELKKALNQIDQGGRDMFGRAADGGLAADQARAVRDATINATGGQSGPYAQAVAIGGDKIEMDRALEFGLKMLRNSDQTSREMVKETLEGMSSDGRAMMRRGLRSYLDELMAKVKAIPSDPDGLPAREALASLKELSSRSAQDKMRLLLGPAEFDKLKPMLDEAMSSQAMKSSVARNSATAIRQSIQGTVDEITQPGLLGQIARGEPVNATKRLTQELLNTTPGADAARKEQIWSEVAQVLSERRGNKSAQAALEYIEKALAGQPLREAEAQFIARQTVLAVPLLSSRAGNTALKPPQ